MGVIAIYVGLQDRARLSAFQLYVRTSEPAAFANLITRDTTISWIDL